MAEVAVDPARLAGHGRTLCELAETLAGVRSTWATSTGQPGDALGYQDTTAAFTAMHDLWFEELGVHVRLLQELCQAVRAAAAGYHGSDAASAGDLLGSDHGRGSR